MFANLRRRILGSIPAFLPAPGPRPPGPGQKPGFTIIEYLIAMSIMASVMAFSTALFFSNQKNISTSTSLAEEQSNLRMLTVRITKQLQNSQVLQTCVNGGTCDANYTPSQASANTPANTAVGFYNPDNNNQITAAIATSGGSAQLSGLEQDWVGSNFPTSSTSCAGTTTTRYMIYQGIIAFIKMVPGSCGINTNGDPIFNYKGSTRSGCSSGGGKLSVYFFDTTNNQLHYQEYEVTNSSPPWQINSTYYFDSVVFSGFAGKGHGDNANGEITDFQVMVTTNPSAPCNWPANYPVSYSPPPGYVGRVTFNYAYTIYSAQTSTQSGVNIAARAKLRQTMTVHILNSA